MARLWDDPAAWNAYLAEGNARQARKRVAAHVLFRDAAGHVLLVEPTYKPDLELPGGMVERNEAPLDAARREVKEELALDAPPGSLLVVDWVTAHAPWDDLLAFIFDGGTLGPTQLASIRLLDGEIGSVRWCSEEEATALLRPRLSKRVRIALQALRAGQPTYLQDGVPAA
jgi:8-oxo-dGTP pyrophosphatase MutT (NUDIX family)